LCVCVCVCVREREREHMYIPQGICEEDQPIRIPKLELFVIVNDKAAMNGISWFKQKNGSHNNHQRTIE